MGISPLKYNDMYICIYIYVCMYVYVYVYVYVLCICICMPVCQPVCQYDIYTEVWLCNLRLWHSRQCNHQNSGKAINTQSSDITTHIGRKSVLESNMQNIAIEQTCLYLICPLRMVILRSKLLVYQNVSTTNIQGITSSKPKTELQGFKTLQVHTSGMVS